MTTAVANDLWAPHTRALSDPQVECCAEFLACRLRKVPDISSHDPEDDMALNPVSSTQSPILGTPAAAKLKRTQSMVDRLDKIAQPAAPQFGA